MRKLMFINLIFFSHQLMALCNFNLTSNAINETVSNINLDTVQTLTISRPNGTSYSTCSNAYFFFSKGQAGQYNRKAINSFNEVVNYNLYKNSGQFGLLKDYMDFNSVNDYITATMQNPNVSVQSQFYFYLPASTLAATRSGIYTDNIQLNVFRGSNNSQWGYFEFTRNIPIIINVPKSINISLVNSGSPIDLNSTFKNLDFGDLETNEEMSFDMMIASNAGFKISFSSLNNGSLKNTINANTISYSLKVQGNSVNLQNSSTVPVQVASGSGVTGAAGARLPVSVKIGTVNDSLWGDYQDYITITAATND